MNESAHGVETDKAENPENDRIDCTGLEFHGPRYATA